jgi:hypothetical protein
MKFDDNKIFYVRFLQKLSDQLSELTDTRILQLLNAKC